MLRGCCACEVVSRGGMARAVAVAAGRRLWCLLLFASQCPSYLTTLNTSERLHSGHADS